MQKIEKAVCRCFYIRKDGTIYVQTAPSGYTNDIQGETGETMLIPVRGNYMLVGHFVVAKKCGIVLSGWILRTETEAMSLLPDRYAQDEGGEENG